MSSESKNPLHGKSWTNGKIYNTYEPASDEKKRIEESSKDLAVKIRRTSENRFQIKTRSTAVVESKKKSDKENGKPKSKSQRKKEKAARHKARQEKE